MASQFAGRARAKVNSALSRRRSSSIWAILDSLAQRGGSAFVLLVVSWASNPVVVGQISAAMIALTFYQAALEAPIRQTAHRVIRAGESGSDQVQRLALRSGLLGVLGVFLMVLLIYATGFLDSWYPLALLALVPAITATYLLRLIRVQSEGDWQYLAASRVFSISVSLVLSIWLAIQHSATLAVVVQAIVSELIFAILVFRKRLPKVSPAIVLDMAAIRSDLRGTSALSIFGWLRGQTDRIVLLVVAPSAILGFYSLSYAVARAPAEAAVSGSINALRARLASGKSGDFGFIKIVFEQSVKKTAAICVAFYVVACVSSAFLYEFFLGPEWSVALILVPVFASSIFASSFSSNVNALLNHLGLTRRSYRVQVMEILLSIAVGVAFSVDMRLGVVIFVVRDFLSATILWTVSRRFYDSRVIRYWILPFLFSVSISLVFIGYSAMAGYPEF